MREREKRYCAHRRWWLSRSTVFAATDDAGYTLMPFGIKSPRSRVKPSLFEARLATGAKVAGTDPNGGFLVIATVQRSLADRVYELETTEGKRWTVSFEDAVRCAPKHAP